MRWDDLNMGDKSRMIKLAVDSGITDLRTIRDVYNSYAEGGPIEEKKEKYKKPEGASVLKDLAYKVGTYEPIQQEGAATPINIIRAITRKNVPIDDNKYAYIYGTGERYPEMKEPVRGFDYSNYLNRYGYKGVKNVYGTINPNNEYHIDPEYEVLAKELAKHRYHFYDNADDMFIDSDPDNLGYRDDVANFIHQMDLDERGNVLIHDSDVYDFNPADYVYSHKVSKPLVKLEAKLMDKIGTPYIIRQENQPLYFDTSSRGGMGIERHLDYLTEEDIAKITGSGMLEPAIVEAKHPDPNYDPMSIYDYRAGGSLCHKKQTGGPNTVWDPEGTLFNPLPQTEPSYLNKYDKIINERYNSAYNALLDAGRNQVDADRQARLLATHSVNETGWQDSKHNNYAGYLDSSRKLIRYDSPEQFWEKHINNLDSKWPNWAEAENMDQYYNAINHTELGLDTKEKFIAYNRAHRKNPVSIYAPEWDNTNYRSKLNWVYQNMTDKYIPVKIWPQPESAYSRKKNQ